jgi:hypothetical protein
MHLDRDRAHPGDIVKMTFRGSGATAMQTSVQAEFQGWDGERWKTLFYLDQTWIPGEQPAVVSVTDKRHTYRAIGLGGMQPLWLKVPSVRPGTYRVAKDVVRVAKPRSTGTDQHMTLYSRLKVAA